MVVVPPLVLAALCGGVSLVAAAVGAAADAGSLGALWALGLAAMYAAAVATAALEALFGLVGVAVASTLFVFFTAPLFSVRDPRLLPSPWRQVVPWTPHGTTLDLATSLAWFGSSDVVRPVLVLGGVIVVSLVALVAASHFRTESRAVQQQGGDRVRWRLRALAVIVPTALALVAAVALAPAGARVVSATRVPGAAQTEIIPAPTSKISDLKGLNEFASTVRAGAEFQGADVGADVRAAGRSPAVGLRRHAARARLRRPAVRPQLDAGLQPAVPRSCCRPTTGRSSPTGRRASATGRCRSPRSSAPATTWSASATNGSGPRRAGRGLRLREPRAVDRRLRRPRGGDPAADRTSRTSARTRRPPGPTWGAAAAVHRRLGLPLRHRATRGTASSASRCRWRGCGRTTCSTRRGGATGTATWQRTRAAEAAAR